MSDIILKRQLSNSNKRRFQRRTPICPFISSTFVDFQDEREHLVKRIFPRLDSICRERGTFFAPVDLRWGINNEQVRSGHVVQLCLDYTRRCHPFFVCLLGERYGSHRPENSPPLEKKLADLGSNGSWLDKNLIVAGINGYQWILNDLRNQTASITELEIINAVLLNSAQHSYFYFRRHNHVDIQRQKLLHLTPDEQDAKLKIFLSESKYCEKRLSSLKKTIIDKFSDRVREYTTVEELGQMILEDWTNVIDSLYPSLAGTLHGKECELYREWSSHESFSDTLRKVFVQTSSILDVILKLDTFCDPLVNDASEESIWSEKLDRFTFDLRKFTQLQNLRSQRGPFKPQERGSILCLVGGRGTGKSSVLSYWVKKFTSDLKANLMVFSHFVGCSVESMDVAKLASRYITDMREYFKGETSYVNESDIWEILAQFTATLSLGPNIILIDGLNELAASSLVSEPKLLEWMPDALPPTSLLIVSTSPSDWTMKSLAERSDVTYIKLPVLETSANKQAIIASHLRIHCKKMDSHQLEKAVSSPLSSIPRYLASLAMELRLCGGYLTVDSKMEKYICCETLRQFWTEVVCRWCVDYGWKINEEPSSDGDKPSTLAEILECWVGDVLTLLCLSERGLSEGEIIGLLNSLGYKDKKQVDHFELSMLRSAAQDSIFDAPSGLMALRHSIIRETVLYAVLGEVSPQPTHLSSGPAQLLRWQDKRRRYHNIIIDYFLSQPLSARNAIELSFQMSISGKYKQLSQLLSNIFVFRLLTVESDDQIGQFYHYCHILLKQSFNILQLFTGMVELAEIVLHEEKKIKDLENSPSSLPTECYLSWQEMGSHSHLKSTSTNETGVHFFTSNDVRVMHSSMARMYYQVGLLMRHFEFEEGVEEFFFRALFHMQQLGLEWLYQEANQRFYIDCMAGVGEILLILNKLPIARRRLAEALDTVDNFVIPVLDPHDEKSLSDAYSLKVRLMLDLARLELKSGDFKRSESLVHDVLVLSNDYKPLSVRCQTFHLMSRVQHKLRHFAESDVYFKRSLNSIYSLYGMNHKLVADLLTDYAILLSDPEFIEGLDIFEAKSHLKRALAIYTSAEKPLLCAQVLIHLGEIFLNDGRLNMRLEGDKCLQRALDIQKIHLGEDHPQTQSTMKLYNEVTRFYFKKSVVKPVGVKRRSKAVQRAASSLSWNDQDLNHLKADRKRTLSPIYAANDDSELVLLSWCCSPSGCARPRARSLSPPKHSHGSCKMPSRNSTCLESINGPSSKLEDLVIDKPIQYSSPNTVHHMSAWYHVPGRYSTSTRSLPQKYKQIRNL